MIERLGFSSPKSPTITSGIVFTFLPVLTLSFEASVNDSPLLAEQILSLSRSVSCLQKKLARSEGRSLSKRVSTLQPLPK